MQMSEDQQASRQGVPSRKQGRTKCLAQNRQSQCVSGWEVSLLTSVLRGSSSRGRARVVLAGPAGSQEKEFSRTEESLGF